MDQTVLIIYVLQYCCYTLRTISSILGFYVSTQKSGALALDSFFKKGT